MAIQFVGSQSTSVTTSFLHQTNSFTITSLTGGIASAPQAGDIVLLLRASSDSVTALDVAGYTTILSSGPFYSAYRIMGATPATTLSLYTPASESTVTIVMVFRGVDQTVPLDTTSGSASSTNSVPDPASITTATNNALAVVLASSKSGTTAVTGPTGYSTPVVRGQTGPTISGYACYKTVATAGAENPSAFTGITSATGAAYSSTIALRPAASTATGNAKVWNGSAWVAKPVKVWNGSAWVTKPVKRWNGTAWVTTTY